MKNLIEKIKHIFTGKNKVKAISALIVCVLAITTISMIGCRNKATGSASGTTSSETAKPSYGTSASPSAKSSASASSSASADTESNSDDSQDNKQSETDDTDSSVPSDASNGADASSNSNSSSSNSGGTSSGNDSSGSDTCTAVQHPAVTHVVHHDATYTTVHHDAVTKLVVDSPEKVVGTYICCGCGAEFATVGEWEAHRDAYLVKDDYNHTGWRSGFKTIPEISHVETVSPAYDEKVQVTAAWDETVVDKAAYTGC